MEVGNWSVTSTYHHAQKYGKDVPKPKSPFIILKFVCDLPAKLYTRFNMNRLEVVRIDEETVLKTVTPERVLQVRFLLLPPKHELV